MSRALLDEEQAKAWARETQGSPVLSESWGFTFPLAVRNAQTSIEVYWGPLRERYAHSLVSGFGRTISPSARAHVAEIALRRNRSLATTGCWFDVFKTVSGRTVVMPELDGRVDRAVLESAVARLRSTLDAHHDELEMARKNAIASDTSRGGARSEQDEHQRQWQTMNALLSDRSLRLPPLSQDRLRNASALPLAAAVAGGFTPDDSRLRWNDYAADLRQAMPTIDWVASDEVISGLANVTIEGAPRTLHFVGTYDARAKLVVWQCALRTPAQRELAWWGKLAGWSHATALALVGDEFVAWSPFFLDADGTFCRVVGRAAFREALEDAARISGWIEQGPAAV